VRRADLICVLDQGRVQELGSHDELVARAGRYARMFALQSAGFERVGDQTADQTADQADARVGDQAADQVGATGGPQ
jgi:hypothetical protein